MHHVAHLAVWHHPASSGRARAILLLVHGISEHSGRHLNTVDYFCAHGFDVVRFDLRGAGQSGGRRQWVERFEDYVEDVNLVFNWIHRTLPPAPIFLLGHSLGGLISIHWAAVRGNELQGLLLSAPAFHLGSAVSPLKVQVGKLLRRFVPKMKMPKSTDSSAVSRDPRVVQEFQADPLSVHHNTLNQGAEILDAIDEVLDRVDSIHCPVFLAHGTHDRLIRLEGSYEIVRRLKAPDKVLWIRPLGYHEPHNDLDKESYFQEVEIWMNDRLKAVEDQPRRGRARAPEHTR